MPQRLRMSCERAVGELQVSCKRGANELYSKWGLPECPGSPPEGPGMPPEAPREPTGAQPERRHLSEHALASLEDN